MVDELVPNPTARRRAVHADWVVAALGLLVLLAWDASGADMAVERLFGNGQGFAWRDVPAAAVAMHAGARGIAGAALAWLALGVLHPLPPLHGLTRADRLWCFVTTATCMVAVTLIKAASTTSCPWSLAEFGGVAAHVSHLRWGVPDGGPGGCFPSGHASVAFAFIAGHFVLRRDRPGAAAAWLAIVCGLGLLLGSVQVLRGAHYVSHVLYTAWFCWAIAAALHHVHVWHAARRAAGGGTGARMAAWKARSEDRRDTPAA